MSHLRFLPVLVATVALAFASRVPAVGGEDFKNYTETIAGHDGVEFEMIAIPGGTFTMGSPESEAGRTPEETPHEVEIKPFWMGKCEVTWDEFDIFAFKRDLARKKLKKVNLEAQAQNEKDADGVTRPTPPYVEMTFGFGHDGYPAICFTHHMAMKYCEWLSAKTGKSYRLPTEAEWEYACRAGSKTAYSNGADASKLDDVAWFESNSDKKPHPVGQKKPNAFGIYDMHGNVAEWCLDSFKKDAYTACKDKCGPVILPTKDEYPYVLRGGSWQDKPEKLRSAARRGSDLSLSARDPQLPQSIWWHTDAQGVGFRVVRALSEQENLKGVKSQVKVIDLKTGGGEN